MLLSLPSLDSEMHWRAWLEYQPRWDIGSLTMYQTVLRPGIGWQSSPEVSLWAGYAWIGTFRPQWLGEHRFWQQVFWTPNSHMSIRARIEERLFAHGTELRIRNQMRVVWPISVVPAIIANELFINAGAWNRSTAVGYDQNRLFVGVLLPLGFGLRVECGYMNIHYRGNRMRHVVAVSVIHQP